MKSKNMYSINLTKKEIAVVKTVFEYFVMNADENYLCEECNERLLPILDMFTKLTDGKSLSE